MHFPSWLTPAKRPTSFDDIKSANVPSEKAEHVAEILSARISANVTRSVRRSIQIREALGEEMLLAMRGGKP